MVGAFRGGTFNHLAAGIGLNGRIDFRVSKYVTIGSHFGVRNGMLGGGGIVRFHFLK